MDRLKSKVCIITGRERLAVAAAMMFAREGAEVVAATSTGNSANATLDAVRSAGGRMVFAATLRSRAARDVDRLMQLPSSTMAHRCALHNGAMAYFRLAARHEL